MLDSARSPRIHAARTSRASSASVRISTLLVVGALTLSACASGPQNAGGTSPAASGAAVDGGTLVYAEVTPINNWQTQAARFYEKSNVLNSVLADPAVAGRQFDGYFGPATVGGWLAGFYGVDLIVHRWDLAVSQGLDAGLTEADLAAVDAAMDMFGELAYAPGLFGAPVPVPEGAGRCSLVLARTGRKA